MGGVVSGYNLPLSREVSTGTTMKDDVHPKKQQSPRGMRRCRRPSQKEGIWGYPYISTALQTDRRHASVLNGPSEDVTVRY